MICMQGNSNWVKKLTGSLLQRSSLLTDKNVVAYLGLKEPAESGLAGEEASNEPDDFS